MSKSQQSVCCLKHLPRRTELDRGFRLVICDLPRARKSQMQSIQMV